MEQKDAIKNILIRQNEYFKYLYEQEHKRTTSIITAVKVYIAFLVFFLGTIFLKVITIDNIIVLFNNTSIPQ